MSKTMNLYLTNTLLVKIGPINSIATSNRMAGAAIWQIVALGTCEDHEVT